MHVTSRRRADEALLLLTLALLESPRAAFLRCFVASNLVRRFRDQSGNLDGPASAVDRDESQVARIRVAAATGEQLFRLDADADLHRGTADVVDARFENDQIAEMDR